MGFQFQNSVTFDLFCSKKSKWLPKGTGLENGAHLVGHFAIMVHFYWKGHHILKQSPNDIVLASYFLEIGCIPNPQVWADPSLRTLVWSKLEFDIFVPDPEVMDVM